MAASSRWNFTRSMRCCSSTRPPAGRNPARVADSATGEYLARVLRGEPLVPLSHVTFAEESGRPVPPVVPVMAEIAPSRKRAAAATPRARAEG